MFPDQSVIRGSKRVNRAPVVLFSEERAGVLAKGLCRIAGWITCWGQSAPCRFGERSRLGNARFTWSLCGSLARLEFRSQGSSPAALYVTGHYFSLPWRRAAASRVLQTFLVLTKPFHRWMEHAARIVYAELMLMCITRRSKDAPATGVGDKRVHLRSSHRNQPRETLVAVSKRRPALALEIFMWGVVFVSSKLVYRILYWFGIQFLWIDTVQFDVLESRQLESFVMFHILWNSERIGNGKINLEILIFIKFSWKL